MSFTPPSELRKWLAVGAGVGIEIGTADLRVVAARVRPSGAAVLGTLEIPRFRERPAGEWGGEYAAFLKRLGVSHLAAAVLLPRRDVIVRSLSLPGVPDKDLESAIRFQVDSLHPYPEEEAAWAWARTGSSVLIGIARRETIDRTIALFTEAGVKVASFTFSAAALYSALRLISTPPAGGFLAIGEDEGGLELYGESDARPLYSAHFAGDQGRAAGLAAADLRLEGPVEPKPLAAVLPPPKTFPKDFDLSRNALAYAAALAGACPRLALAVNLLPAVNRSTSSRALYIPTVALAALLLVMAVALAALSPLENRRYLAGLEAEITGLEPQAAKAATLDKETEKARARIRLLDEFRRRSKADLDALNELTRLIQPPAWLNTVEITRDSVTIAGEAESAAALLKLLDESPLFRDSEFTMPMARAGAAETFRIRALREGQPQ